MDEFSHLNLAEIVALIRKDLKNSGIKATVRRDYWKAITITKKDETENSVIKAITDKYDWDHSDTMIDYYDVNFYVDIVRSPAK